MWYRIKWQVSFTLILLAGYFIISVVASRAFGSDYPTLVLMIVSVVFIPAVLLKKKVLSGMVILGYCGGFLAGYILDDPVYLPGSIGSINNWWGIWNNWCLAIIAIGFVLEYLNGLRAKH